jgi:hypothetical protein
MAIPFQFHKAQRAMLTPADTSGRGEAADPSARSCGECQACCIHLPIPAGHVCINKKPAGVACPQLADHGCGNYDDRPETCRQFRCAWFCETTWPAQWRPDRSGLLCLREEIDDGVPAAVAYEIELGAIERSTTAAILAQLQQSTAVIALLDMQRQRQVLRGNLWVDPAGHAVRRPHFLKPINAVNAPADRAAG